MSRSMTLLEFRKAVAGLSDWGKVKLFVDGKEVPYDVQLSPNGYIHIKKVERNV